jgi:hypothetical protein
MHRGVFFMGAGILGAGRCFGSRKHKYQGYVLDAILRNLESIWRVWMEAWRVGG